MAEMILPDIKVNTRQYMQAFLPAISTAFGSRCQEHLGMNGLLGFCVSDAQWPTLPGVAVADQLNDGAFIIADRPTIIFTPAPELGISEALRLLKNSIIDSLPESDKNELSDPSFGLVSVSCPRTNHGSCPRML